MVKNKLFIRMSGVLMGLSMIFLTYAYRMEINLDNATQFLQKLVITKSNGNIFASINSGGNSYFNYGDLKLSGDLKAHYIKANKFCNNSGTNCKTIEELSGGTTIIQTSGGTFTEHDPKIGTLNSGKWCTSNGSQVICNTDFDPSSISTEESDPIFNSHSGDYYTKDDIEAITGNYYTRTYITGNYYTRTYITGNYYTKYDIKTITGNYYTKDDIEAITGNYYTKNDIEAITGNYYTKNDIKTITGNYYTKDDIKDITGNYYTKNYINWNYYTKNYINGNYYTKANIQTSFQAKDMKGKNGDISKGEDEECNKGKYTGDNITINGGDRGYCKNKNTRNPIYGSTGNVILASNDGKVGIGTETPKATLDVEGTLKLKVYSGDIDCSDKTGVIFLSGDYNLYICNNGTATSSSNTAQASPSQQNN